jgi:hypothetical protein
LGIAIRYSPVDSPQSPLVGCLLGCNFAYSRGKIKGNRCSYCGANVMLAGVEWSTIIRDPPTGHITLF